MINSFYHDIDRLTEEFLKRQGDVSTCQLKANGFLDAEDAQAEEIYRRRYRRIADVIDVPVHGCGNGPGKRPDHFLLLARELNPNHGELCWYHRYYRDD